MVDSPGGDQPSSWPGTGVPAYPQSWGSQDMPSPREPLRARNGLGVAALVLGIISLPGIITIVVGVVLGILAIIFGAIGVRRAHRGEATNVGMAIAGIVTGAIGLIVSVVIVAIGASFFVSHNTQIHDYTQCVSNAHTQQARAACATRFNHQLKS
ncbi:MAG: DUF4190 domain-containing protein [Acidimicrobiales bacterium]